MKPALTRRNVPGLADGMLLVALAVYILAGLPLATFHGDEAMHIYMSGDFTTAFIDGQPWLLTADPPYRGESDAHLRILNGPLTWYAIGLARHAAGLADAQLPPGPGWRWDRDYATNAVTGQLPGKTLLNVARVPPAIFLALSMVVMFLLGWQLGGRKLAWWSGLLYVLNPVVLLNGRRAMLEGAALFWGLLAILLAAVISRKLAREVNPAWWLGFALAGGLALASKHSAMVYVGSALGWIIIAAVVARRGRALLLTGLSAIMIVVTFVALSPALWNNPPARVRDMLAARIAMVEVQAGAVPMSLAQRAGYILLQPFLAPVAHYEISSWAEIPAVAGAVSAYMASPLSGLHFGVLLGLPLSILALAGLALLLLPRLRPAVLADAQAAGLLFWLLLTVVMLMANPLPWQRYYLPLIPLATLLAGIGLLPLEFRRRQGRDVAHG